MEKYELVKDIGAGNFGVARLMRNKETKELVAMKYIERGHKVHAFFFFFSIHKIEKYKIPMLDFASKFLIFLLLHFHNLENRRKVWFFRAKGATQYNSTCVCMCLVSYILFTARKKRRVALGWRPLYYE